MNKSLRKAVIAGNWKMNKTKAETAALIGALAADSAVEKTDVDVIVCVPFTDIDAAVAAAKGTNVKVAAQNVHWAASGAFTGEISAQMLLDAGVNYAVIGHSERRQFFGETDQTVNQRVIAALAAGITPIMCIGEYLQQRKDDVTDEVLAMQLKLGLKNIPAADAKRIIIAYEPVWAIGTGETATAEQADDACKVIRDVLADLYDRATADSIVIQYGGSMNAKNARELLQKEHVDGGLIGGASLKAEDFLSIIRTANELY
jgi:triosephosphate isomerase